MNQSVPWESYRGDLKKVALSFLTFHTKKIFLLFLKVGTETDRLDIFIYWQIEYMKKEVGVLLATFNQLSKPFLSKIVCYIWFHGGDAWSAWSDFPGLGCMNSCTGHNWNASPLMCWHVLFEVTPLCEGRGTMGAMKGLVEWALSMCLLRICALVEEYSHCLQL